MGIQERRQRERKARRKAVLDAARRLVRERGYQGMTTKQIAAECELSEATVFWYFQSKDEIFTSLLFEAIEFMQGRLDVLAAESRADPRETMRRVWHVFEALRTEYPEYFQVFTSLASPAATVAVSEEVKRELARRSGDNFRRVADLLEGSLGPDLARAAVDAAWGLFVGTGVLHDSRMNLDIKPGRQDAELPRAIDLMLDGLLEGT